MADKQSNVVLNFKMNGEVQYAKTISQINMVMNTAAKEYKNHIAAMGKDADATDKLTAEKKKLETQLNAAKERTKMLSDEFESMSKDTNTSAEALQKMYNKLLDSQKAEATLEQSLDRVNEGLTDQAIESREAGDKLKQLGAENKSLEAEQKALTSSFKLQRAEMGDNASEADKMELAQKQLSQQTDLTRRIVDNLEQQLEETKKAYGENSTEAMQMSAKLNEAKTKVAQLEGGLGDLGDSAGTAGDDFEELGKKVDAGNLMDAADKIGEISDKLIDMGNEAIASSTELGNAANRVNNAFDLTGSAAESTKQSIQNLYEKGLGDSFDSVGEAIQQVQQQLGDVGSSKELESITESAMNLSDTFDMDMSESLRGVNALMVAYGISAQDALDLIASGAQNGLNKTDELGDNLSEYAPLFEQNGYSAQEMFSALQAGLDNGAYNLDKVNDLVKEFGIRVADGSVKTAVGDLGKDWESMYDKMKKGGASNQEIFTALAKKVQGLKSEQEKATAISAIWGSQGEDNGTKVIEAMADVNQSYKDVSGTMDEINQKNAANNEWDASIRRVQDSLIPLGDIIKQTLTPFLEFFAQVADGFAELPGPIQQLMVALGGVTVAVGLVLPIVAALAAAAGAAGLSIGAFLVSLAPVVGIVAAVAAGIAALVLVIQNWGTIIDWITGVFSAMGINVSGIWNSIQSTISSVVGAVTSFVQSTWGSLVSWWQANNQLIMSTASIVWNGIKTVISVVMSTLAPLVTGVWNQIKIVTTTVWNVIKTVVTTAIKVVQNIIKAVMQAINGDWKGAWNSIKAAGTAVWNGIKSIVSSVFKGILLTISNILNTILNTWKRTWNNVKSAGSSIIHSISSMATSTFRSMVSTVSGIFKGLTNAIVHPVQTAKSLLSSAISGIKNLFNFKISWPHIPLPHFSISGSANPLDWLKKGTPKISVDWRAKGGIFTEPTIFGAAGGRLQGIGEAGPEAALPLNQETLGAIGDGIVKAMGNRSGNIVVPVYLNGREIARASTPYIDSELHSNAKQQQFGLGR